MNPSSRQAKSKMVDQISGGTFPAENVHGCLVMVVVDEQKGYFCDHADQTGASRRNHGHVHGSRELWLVILESISRSASFTT